MKKGITICIITSVLICADVRAQNILAKDIMFIQQLEGIKHNHTSYRFVFHDDQGSIRRLFSNLFIGYKRFVSSQDAQHCGFEPSCSVYGMLALKHHGFYGGMLRTFDRMSRCNGVNQKDYPVHQPTGLKYDPLIP